MTEDNNSTVSKLGGSPLCVYRNYEGSTLDRTGNWFIAPSSYGFGKEQYEQWIKWCNLHIPKDGFTTRHDALQSLHTKLLDFPPTWQHEEGIAAA